MNRFRQLHDATQELSCDADTPAPRAQLVAEISERLIEWGEVDGRDRVVRWLLTLATIAGDAQSSDALWLYLRISTGDLSQITASFAENGAKRSRSKQAESKETTLALAVIAKHKPALAEQIHEVFRIR